MAANEAKPGANDTAALVNDSSFRRSRQADATCDFESLVHRRLLKDEL
ncbi:MAG: hypothetical protein MUC96_06005 [Myxococcaceae bacterium]|jgi:hypothetical protein|nr:hypothetical protein [Myxococcaceae bacterium]